MDGEREKDGERGLFVVGIDFRGNERNYRSGNFSPSEINANYK